MFYASYVLLDSRTLHANSFSQNQYVPLTQICGDSEHLLGVVR